MIILNVPWNFIIKMSLLEIKMPTLMTSYNENTN